MDTLIVNRVAESEIQVYNLEDLWDNKEIVSFDLAPFLFRGLILKEADFRQKMSELDLTLFADKHVAISCSTDAVIPRWAYVLVASKLTGHAASVSFGSPEELVRDFYIKVLESEDWSRFEDRIVVIKGCGSDIVPVNAYVLATQKLRKQARKLMYGEPCSSVPIWRRSKDAPSAETRK
jgi:hypothetical protein